jgi:hypothetical protein
VAQKTIPRMLRTPFDFSQLRLDTLRVTGKKVPVSLSAVPRSSRDGVEDYTLTQLDASHHANDYSLLAADTLRLLPTQNVGML